MLARTMPRSRATESAPLWPLAFFVCAVALLWHDTLVAQLAQAPSLSPRHVPPRLAATAGVLTQLAFSGLEAFLYARAWASTGRSLPWLRTAGALFVISSLEAFALHLLQRPDTASLAWLVGARASWQSGIATSGLERAFGAIGLLAVIRLTLTMVVLARGARVRHAHAAAVVVAGWLGSRLLLWWSADLLRGRSFGM